MIISLFQWSQFLSVATVRRDRVAFHWCAMEVCGSFAVLTTLLLAESAAKGDVDHFAAAKAAERLLHAACDEWSTAHAEGKGTAAAAARIERAYEDFYAHTRDLNHDPGAKNQIVYVATGVRPTRDIVSAGMLRSCNGDEWSYVVWRSERSLMMTQWKREDWRKHVFRPGVVAYLVRQGACSASLTIEPDELASHFNVRAATWTDRKQQQVLCVPYEIKGTSGVIEIRRNRDHWQMKPDRGVVAANGVWRPFGASHLPGVEPNVER